MDTVIQALRNGLSLPPDAVLSGDTVLGTLPGWDSMNAINVQMEIETLVNRTELPLDLSGNVKIRDVVEQLERLHIKA